MVARLEESYKALDDASNVIEDIHVRGVVDGWEELLESHVHMIQFTLTSEF